MFLCKNDGNALSHSILLVSKIVRKQGPFKIENQGHILLCHFLIRAKLSELRRFHRDLCTHFAQHVCLAVQCSEPVSFCFWHWNLRSPPLWHFLIRFKFKLWHLNCFCPNWWCTLCAWTNCAVRVSCSVISVHLYRRTWRNTGLSTYWDLIGWSLWPITNLLQNSG